MEMKELEITIDKTGRVQVAVRGVQGESCLDLTKNIENAVGTVEEREYLAEYYEQPVNVSDNQYVNRRSLSFCLRTASEKRKKSAL
jgi:hypothetical protein